MHSLGPAPGPGCQPFVEHTHQSAPGNYTRAHSAALLSRHTLSLEQHQLFGPTPAHLWCSPSRDSLREVRGGHTPAAGWAGMGQGLGDWPGTIPGSKDCVFWGTDLFPNTILSSSRTVFSFTCSSFRLSAASGSNCIHRRQAWLSWFSYPFLLSCGLHPSLLGLYSNAY